VLTLRKKFLKAVKYKPLFQESVDSIERSVVDNHGKDMGADLLKAWREEEANFKQKVVDFCTYREILESPYNLSKPIGERQILSDVTIL
jgi:hypothetical protein